MIRPIGNKLVVRLRSRQDMSKGGIHIPEAAQHAEEWGVCVAVGDEVEDVEPDEVVFIKQTQGTHYRSGGEDYIIIEEHRVLCKLTNESDPDADLEGEELGKCEFDHDSDGSCDACQ